MLLNTGVMTIVAHQFLLSSSVASYFTVGAGSLGIGSEPGVGGRDLRPGRGRHRRRRRCGRLRLGGGGFDGGAFGGGFDAGGFGGGGFDGGGGFGG